MMKRKAITILLICIIVCSGFVQTSDFYADKEKAKMLELIDYVDDWFEVNNLGNHVISDPIVLYSLSGGAAAVRFRVDTIGYVVVSTINYDVLEFSLDNSPSLDTEKKNIYNGFLCYYEEAENKVEDVSSGNTIDKGQVYDFFKAIDSQQHEELSSKATKLSEFKHSANDSLNAQSFSRAQNSFFEYGNLNHDLVE